MQAGSGRAGGLTDVVRAQLERWQDHPNTGRYARVDAVARCLSLTSSPRKRLEKESKKKETASSRRGALPFLATGFRPLDNCKGDAHI